MFIYYEIFLHKYILDGDLSSTFLSSFGRTLLIHIFRLVCRGNAKKKHIFENLWATFCQSEWFKRYEDNF